MDFEENIILFSIKIKETKSALDEKMVSPKAFLCYTEGQNMGLEELPLVADNTEMVASAIGKDFVIYYDTSQKNVFSYQVFNLKSKTFSEKFSVNIKGLRRNDVYFNSRKNVFVTFRDIRFLLEKEVIVFELYSTKANAISENDL